MAYSHARGFCIAAFLLWVGMVWAPLVQAQAHVSLDVRNADVREALIMIAEAGGLNVVIGPDVTGTVTLRLQDVPVEEALQTVLNTAGLIQVREGKTMGMLSRKAWLQQQRHQAQPQGLGSVQTRLAIVPLRYAKAVQLAPVLPTCLSPWGTIADDERTNSLVIRDVPESPVFQQHQGAP